MKVPVVHLARDSVGRTHVREDLADGMAQQALHFSGVGGEGVDRLGSGDSSTRGFHCGPVTARSGLAHPYAPHGWCEDVDLGAYLLVL